MYKQQQQNNHFPGLKGFFVTEFYKIKNTNYKQTSSKMEQEGQCNKTLYKNNLTLTLNPEETI